MADSKLTALSALSVATADDILYIVDDPGGTPASKKITAVNLLMALLQTEVAVTGATTATINTMHKVSGTSADYTITLPAASGNGGKLIGFRVLGSADASKIYTLDGNASETIDGATTRLLWAEESCVLLCDGSNWFKIAGKSRPMVGKISKTTAMGSAFSANTLTKITYDTSSIDNTGLMVDTSNNRLTIKRAGTYLAVHALQFNDGITTGEYTSISVCLNAITSGDTIGETVHGYGDDYDEMNAMAYQSFAVGDLLYGAAQVESSGVNIITGKPTNWLMAQEVPTW